MRSTDCPRLVSHLHFSTAGGNGIWTMVKTGKQLRLPILSKLIVRFYSGKADLPDYPPPPPFVPLNPATISTQLPALLHAFYASRIESGLGVSEDDSFDATHSVIGSLGQIVVKNPNTGMKKKREREVRDSAEGNGEVVKKPKVKKVV
jgi:hypothetical protein